MIQVQNVLSPEDYKNYRNVRAAAVMFIVLGGLLAFGGLMMLVVKPQGGEGGPPAAAAVLFALFGLCGLTGGIAVLAGNRKWSGLIYVMGAVYVLAFPIGTILSLVMFIGLSRYLNSVETYRAALAGGGR